MKKGGTTFTLPKDIIKQIDQLRKLRMDTTRAQTIRYLLLRQLKKGGGASFWE